MATLSEITNAVDAMKTTRTANAANVANAANWKANPVYRLCPRCFRAVPAHSSEYYCCNDGEKLLEGCPRCHTPIHSPFARFCTLCGLAFAPLERMRVKKGG